MLRRVNTDEKNVDKSQSNVYPTPPPTPNHASMSLTQWKGERMESETIRGVSHFAARINVGMSLSKVARQLGITSGTTKPVRTGKSGSEPKISAGAAHLVREGRVSVRGPAAH
ncbi:hypothetical protein P4S72_12520 [Vibrio sp. PP-XX7]